MSANGHDGLDLESKTAEDTITVNGSLIQNSPDEMLLHSLRFYDPMQAAKHTSLAIGFDEAVDAVAATGLADAVIRFTAVEELFLFSGNQLADQLWTVLMQTSASVRSINYGYNRKASNATLELVDKIPLEQMLAFFSSHPRAEYFRVRQNTGAEYSIDGKFVKLLAAACACMETPASSAIDEFVNTIYVTEEKVSIEALGSEYSKNKYVKQLLALVAKPDANIDRLLSFVEVTHSGVRALARMACLLHGLHIQHQLSLDLEALKNRSAVIRNSNDVVHTAALIRTFPSGLHPANKLNDELKRLLADSRLVTTKQRLSDLRGYLEVAQAAMSESSFPIVGDEEDKLMGGGAVRVEELQIPIVGATADGADIGNLSHADVIIKIIEQRLAQSTGNRPLVVELVRFNEGDISRLAEIIRIHQSLTDLSVLLTNAQLGNTYLPILKAVAKRELRRTHLCFPGSKLVFNDFIGFLMASPLLRDFSFGTGNVTCTLSSAVLVRIRERFILRPEVRLSDEFLEEVKRLQISFEEQATPTRKLLGHSFMGCPEMSSALIDSMGFVFLFETAGIRLLARVIALTFAPDLQTQLVAALSTYMRPLTLERTSRTAAEEFHTVIIRAEKRLRFYDLRDRFDNMMKTVTGGDGLGELSRLKVRLEERFALRIELGWDAVDGPLEIETQTATPDVSPIKLSDSFRRTQQPDAEPMPTPVSCCSCFNKAPEQSDYHSLQETGTSRGMQR